MAKSKETRKESKKKPAKSLKEKRAAKKEKRGKKQQQFSFPVNINLDKMVQSFIFSP